MFPARNHGRSNTIVNTNTPNYNFTGLYQHAKSGLDVAVFRFYDPDFGRWLSRDPIGEGAGLNLYAYVSNAPISGWDRLGFFDLNVIPPSPEKDWGDQSPISPSEFSVGGHGSPQSMLDSNENDLSPQKLAGLIKGNPKFTPTIPVRLYACSTGKTQDANPPFAQELADALGSPVIAPDSIVIIHLGGLLTLPAYGNWLQFNPRPH